MMKEEKSKEQAIIEAAEHEFLERGFETATMTNIAAQAGVTHALLHYYFRSKEKLFDLIFEKKVILLKESLLSSFDNKDLPFCLKIRHGVEAHFDFLKAHPALPRFIINELISKPARMKLVKNKIKTTIESILEQLAAEIEKEVREGRINPVDPLTLLIDIASMNVFVFAVLPLLRHFAVEPCGGEEAFLEARKKENVTMIMRRLEK
jgi:AcrR family transcriptional regulator